MNLKPIILHLGINYGRMEQTKKDDCITDLTGLVVAMTKTIPSGTPHTVNWINLAENVLTPIRNQGRCSCCWAMVVVSIIECFLKLNSPDQPLKTLSTQRLIDCVEIDPPLQKQDAVGCYTSSINEGFRFAVDNPIYAEIDYPFKERRESCRTLENPTEAVKIKGFHKIDDRNQMHVLMKVALHPVGAAIDMYPEFCELGKEIYRGPSPRSKSKGLHAVLIVGYEVDELTGEDIWLIQSSWGTSWGDNGIGKVSRTARDKGKFLVRRTSYPKL